MNIEQARFNMIEQQVRPWDVLNSQVLETMAAVPRELFAPPKYRNLAFCDVEVPIGHGEAMLRPAVEGRLLQALRLEPTDIALEIGTGSGFLTACLARMAASVVSVEFYQDLSETARQKLITQGIGNVTLRVGDASKQWSGDGRFDAIAMTGSLPEVPENYRRQLQINGRLFVITGAAPVMEATLITRVADDQWAEESLFETDLRCLVNAEQETEFAL
jgi:protein-L-isoaspartate(D-aspartate) O-methyltransferase